jgi:NADH dehydrogenase [ubiquinone] 1 alpha subcomplex assembly factor 7
MSGPDITGELADRIAKDGPISVAAYMEAIAGSYYSSGHVFGKDGDFVTAPEVSQIYGELIGLWCVTAWQALGQPRHINIVECGPGRGTLMADAMRAIGEVIPAFLNAASIHLVERSPALRSQQRTLLRAYDVEWHDDLSTLPYGQLIIIGNEFLDALPVHQYERTAAGWCERLVSYSSCEFSFTTAPLPANVIDETFDDAPVGSIIEHSGAVEDTVKKMAQLCIDRHGVALMIDYGHTQSDIGETLQAVKYHSYHPVLKDPGTADITAHVDFAQVAQTARSEGASVLGPIEQGVWLRRIGASVREAQLCADKTPEAVVTIKESVSRLIDAEGMGTLFKVIALAPREIGSLAGFEVER